jgi:hypothetical protein
MVSTARSGAAGHDALQEDILGLQVAMQQPVFVAALQAQADLHQPFQDNLRCVCVCVCVCVGIVSIAVVEQMRGETAPIRRGYRFSCAAFPERRQDHLRRRSP